MWNRKDSARILALAAIVLAVGLFLFPPVARPATRPPCGATCLAHKLGADVVNCRLTRGRLHCKVGWLSGGGRCAYGYENRAGALVLHWFAPCLLPLLPPHSGRGMRN